MSYDKSIYDQAEAELSRRRFDAEKLQKARTSKITGEIPEIAELDNELTQTVIELSKLIVAKQGDFEQRFNSIRENNLQAQRLKAELLTAHGYPADYLDVNYFCEKCSDKGFVNGIRCDCFERLLKKYAIERLNRSANMPQCDFEHFSLDYYNGQKTPDGTDCRDKMSEIYECCKSYADTFSTSSPSLFLYGKTGTGKTHISLSIAKRAAERGFNVAYGSLINYLTLIEREHFGKVEGGGDTMNLLIGAELLILDDLGSEFSTGFYESVTYNIINSRINLSLPTIISTNLSVAELQNKYNDRIISRIFGSFNTLCFVGTDIRQIKRINENT